MILRLLKTFHILVYNESVSDRLSRWKWLFVVRPSLPGDADTITPSSAFLAGLGSGDVAPAGVTSHLTTGRLRRRARWVRAAEELLGGKRGVVGRMFKGRWLPDLPSDRNVGAHNYLLATIQGGAKVLGGGLVKNEGTSDPGCGLYFVVELEDGSTETLFPSLLGHLRQYALFRERTLDLALGLRSRGTEWCKSSGFLPWVSDVAVASAVSQTFLHSTHEKLSASRVNSCLEQSPLPSASL